jgi:hypothetical protein
MQIQTKMAAIDAEVSILTDQIVAARQEYGVKAYDLMADPTGNSAGLMAAWEVGSLWLAMVLGRCRGATSAL